MAGLLGRFVRHLRLQFQLILAPVFLLGYRLGDGALDGRFLFLFVLVHVGLYGGMTAYNSYWDRDEGPIGGMKKPPPVGRGEHWGGLAVQVVSVGLMGWQHPVLGLGGFVLFVLGVMYSHPRWRLKAGPWSSLVTVAVGQGILPFLLGWYAAAGSAGWPPWMVLAAAAAGTLLITGLYPLTQVYQIEEDRRRGDCTFAVRQGPARVFGLAILFFGAGLGGFASLIAAGLFSRFWLAALPLFFAAFAGAVLAWRRRFGRQDRYANHDWAFGISAATAAGFWFFIVLEFYLAGAFPSII